MARCTDVRELTYFTCRFYAMPLVRTRSEKRSEFSFVHNFPAEIVMTNMYAGSDDRARWRAAEEREPRAHCEARAIAHLP